MPLAVLAAKFVARIGHAHWGAVMINAPGLCGVSMSFHWAQIQQDSWRVRAPQDKTTGRPLQFVGAMYLKCTPALLFEHLQAVGLKLNKIDQAGIRRLVRNHVCQNRDLDFCRVWCWRLCRNCETQQKAEQHRPCDYLFDRVGVHPVLSRNI